MANNMVSIVCVATLLIVVFHQTPAVDAYTCYSCSATPSECSCCGSQIVNATTCEGTGCATVFYPDGTVTRKCDSSVNHGCYVEGANHVCGCHDHYCNTEPCQVQGTCGASTATSTIFPTSSLSSHGLTIVTFASIIGMMML